jgi:hypothetical protein
MRFVQEWSDVGREHLGEPRHFAQGRRTPDIAGEHAPVGTAELADAVLAELDGLN